MYLFTKSAMALVLTTLIASGSTANAAEPVSPTTQVLHRTIRIDGLDIFYREAGPRDAPTVLLLHGFPTSSHMFRNLIPYQRDLKNLEFHLLDTGHFALEEDGDAIAKYMRDFLETNTSDDATGASPQ